MENFNPGFNSIGSNIYGVSSLKLLESLYPLQILQIGHNGLQFEFVMSMINKSNNEHLTKNVTNFQEFPWD